MAGNNLDFNTLAEANPATPPAGYTKPAGSDAARIGTVGSFKLFYLSGATQTIWYDDLVLTGSVISAKCVLPVTVSGSAAGACLIDSSANGLMVITSTGTNNFRIFAVANGQLSGGALMTAATAPVANATIELRKTNNDYEVFQNNVKVGTTYTTASYTPTFAGAVSRGGQLRSMESVYVAAQSIDTFTDPIIPGAAASGTQTGYVDGAITADFGGIAFTGTVSGSSLSGSVSSFVDGGLCPLLPAASVSGTFTQGGNTANLTRAVSVPTGLQELRDGGGNPANFSGIVLGDPKYIGQSFADAGNPLTTLDRSYVDPSYGLTIDQDGRVRLNATDHPTDPVPSLPYTTTIWIRRGADGRVYSHNLTIDQEGIVTTPPESITLNLRNIGGTSGSGYVPMPDELKYPTGYFASTVMPLEVIRPAPPEAVIGFFSPDYYGYVGRETQIRITMQGGAYPYAFVIDSAPAGATISNDPTDKQNYSVLKFTPTENGTTTIQVRAYDQDGAQKTMRWTFTTSTDWCVFVEPTGVDSTGRGSFASPFKTLHYARNNTTGGKALILKDGTYTDTQLGITLNNSSINSVLTWTPSGAIIDLATNVQTSPDILFYVNSSNMLAQGFVLRNPHNAGANPRIFSGGSATNYVYQDNIKFEVNGRGGTSNTDNVSCFFLGSTDRHHIAQTRCTFTGFTGYANGWSAFDWYGCSYWAVECNTLSDQVSSNTACGLLWPKGTGNKHGDIRNNEFTTAFAGNLIDVYMANVGDVDGFTGNIDVSFNLIRAVGTAGIIVARASQNGTRLPVWTRRNTIINGVISVARRSYGVTLDCDSDVIQTSIASTDPWKVVVIDQNDPNGVYRPLSWMPSLTASVANYECQANSGVVDSNGILIGAYAQYRGRRGHEIRKGAI